MPVRPVPSLNSRDPTVDDPDYIMLSKSRLDDLIEFLIKNKAHILFALPSLYPPLFLFLPISWAAFLYFLP